MWGITIRFLTDEEAREVNGWPRLHYYIIVSYLILVTVQFYRDRNGHKTTDGCPEKLCYLQQAFCALKDPTLRVVGVFFFPTQGQGTLPN